MYRYFGIAGSLVIFLAVLRSMAAYAGKRREEYSLLNHFISELGEEGVSRGLFRHHRVVSVLSSGGDHLSATG